MCSKPSVISPSSWGSVALAQYPPSIDLSNKLLSSALPLPPHASIVYAIFSPTTSPAPHPDTIEHARRHIIDTRKPSILDSLLCTVHVEKGAPQLYVFSVVSSDGANDPLGNLQFGGLIRKSLRSIIQSLRTSPLDLFLGDSTPFYRMPLTLPRIQLHKDPLFALQKFTITSQRLQQATRLLPSKIIHPARIQPILPLPPQWTASAYPTAFSSRQYKRD
jgi:hypothetical protein